METVLRPPDYEPGAVGEYKITHSCVIDDEQIFHMELRGQNHSWHPALGFLNDRVLVPFDASAIVHNALGHTPDTTGTYRIMEKDHVDRSCIIDALEHAPDATGTCRIMRRDLMDRSCIIDVGTTIGRRMYMKWRIDKLATEKVYKWQAWP